MILAELPEWADGVPYQIKKIAVRDASLAVKAAKKVGGKCKFRSKKTPKQSCFIPSSAIVGSGIYPRISGKLKFSEKTPEDHCDSRLVYENNRWFIVVPFECSVKKPIDSETQRIVALDPGIRTFITGFSENSIFKIGHGDFSRVMRLNLHADKLVSKIRKSKGRKKEALKKL